MSSSNNNASSGGIGFFAILFFIFLILRLTGFIDWSWWWVTAPLWGPAGVTLVGALVWLVFRIIGAFRAQKRLDKKIREMGGRKDIPPKQSRLDSWMDKQKKAQAERLKERRQ